MSEKKRMAVNGFAFLEADMAKKAAREAEGIRYVRERIDMGNPRMVLEMYRKLIKERVFETPVGLMYLKELQDYLESMPETAEAGVWPIPVLESGKKEPDMQAGTQPPAEGGETTEWYMEKLEKATQRERDMDIRRSRAEQRLRTSRGYLRASLLVNLFLAVVASGMIAIALTTDHPNLINYKNKIVDQYEQWEQELEQREQALKEKEQEMGIAP